MAGIAVANEAGGVDCVAAIEIATTRPGYQTSGSEPDKWAPDTGYTADHNRPYLTARAIFDGGLTKASYTSEKLRDPRILAFMCKITVSDDPAAFEKGFVPSRLSPSSTNCDERQELARSCGCPLWDSARQRPRKRCPLSD